MTEAVGIFIGFVVLLVVGVGFWIGGATLRSLPSRPPRRPGAAPDERFGWEVHPEGGKETGETASGTERRQGTVSTTD
jgi:hypothetical protein